MPSVMTWTLSGTHWQENWHQCQLWDSEEPQTNYTILIKSTLWYCVIAGDRKQTKIYVFGFCMPESLHSAFGFQRYFHRCCARFSMVLFFFFFMQHFQLSFCLFPPTHTPAFNSLVLACCGLLIICGCGFHHVPKLSFLENWVYCNHQTWWSRGLH